jgi:hypothetical protein
MTVEDMLTLLKVITAAGSAFLLVTRSKKSWQKVLSILIAELLAHAAYFIAGSIALFYSLIVLPDFLVNLFMPGFAFWGAVFGAVLAYGRMRLGPPPKSTCDT